MLFKKTKILKLMTKFTFTMSDYELDEVLQSRCINNNSNSSTNTKAEKCLKRRYYPCLHTFKYLYLGKMLKA